MRVLLTGARGQVGQALLSALPAGVEVRALGHAELDIADARRVRECVADFVPHVVINAAAYAAVDKAESDPENASRVNAEGPQVLAEAVQKLGHCRLLHISTDFVFDGRSSTPYAPEATPSPLGVYGRSKLEGERAVLRIGTDRAVILRTSWVYAARGSNFMLTMLRLMRERGSVRVVADQVGAPTAAHSVARALWSLAARSDLSGVFHWTDAGVASWYDFAVAIAEEAAVRGLIPAGTQVAPIRTADYPTPAKRPAYSVLDTRSTIQALGLVPQHWRVSLRAVMGEIASG